MRRYFDEMTPLGKELTEKQIADSQENKKYNGRNSQYDK